MLAEGGWEAFDDPRWWFEPKLDGIRCLAELTTGETTLRTRTGRDVTAQYPELRMIHELVDQVNAVIDGEIVAFDADGTRLVRDAAAADEPHEASARSTRVAKPIPVALVVFDLLWLDGHDTTRLKLEERRELLELIVETDHRLQVVTSRRRRGQGVRREREGAGPRGRGREAARLDRTCRAGAHPTGARSSSATRRTAWSSGGRPDRAAAAARSARCWSPRSTTARWTLGRARSARGSPTGPSPQLRETLAGIERDAPPIDDPELAAVKGATFVEPELVCEVEYLEITKGSNKMRAPSFKGLRPDKTPDECVLERPRRAQKGS